MRILTGNYERRGGRGRRQLFGTALGILLVVIIAIAFHPLSLFSRIWHWAASGFLNRKESGLSGKASLNQ
jgi:hypothetical protein